MLKYWIYTRGGRLLGAHTLSSEKVRQFRAQGYQLTLVSGDGR